MERELVRAMEARSRGAGRNGVTTIAGRGRSLLVRSDDDDIEAARYSWRKRHQPESRRAGPSFALHFIYAPRYQRRHRRSTGSGGTWRARAGWITSSSRTNSRPNQSGWDWFSVQFYGWIRNHAVPVSPEGRNARSIFRWNLYRSTRPINAFIRERLFARAGEDLGQPKLRRPLSHRMEHSSSFSRSQRPAHHSLATAGTRGQDTRRTHLLGGFHPGERIEEGPRAPGPRLSGNDRLCRTGAHVNSGAGNSVADYFPERRPIPCRRTGSEIAA